MGVHEVLYYVRKQERDHGVQDEKKRKQYGEFQVFSYVSCSEHSDYGTNAAAYKSYGEKN